MTQRGLVSGGNHCFRYVERQRAEYSRKAGKKADGATCGPGTVVGMRTAGEYDRHNDGVMVAACDKLTMHL